MPKPKKDNPKKSNNAEIESLKETPKKQRGGKRPGSGLKMGQILPKTLEKRRVQAAIAQRVMQNADKLFNAQLSNAVGSVQIFKVVEVSENKREHILVTDPDEIKKVLDEGEGSNCSVDGGFYLVTTIKPETKAIDSMLDRTFGKAPQSIELTADPRVTELKSRIQARAAVKNIPYEQELKHWSENYAGDVQPEVREVLISEIAQ